MFRNVESSIIEAEVKLSDKHDSFQSVKDVSIDHGCCTEDLDSTTPSLVRPNEARSIEEPRGNFKVKMLYSIAMLTGNLCSVSTFLCSC